MNATVKIEHADKWFGSFQALKDVCLKAPQGEITGLIGNNGSGKTVLLKCIVGLMYASSGKITVFDKIIGKDADFAPQTGFIIEHPGFLPSMSGFQNLKYLARLSGRACDADIRAAIERVGLDPASRKSVGKYSLGMKQRLGIAQAIMEKPRLLIFDEPMNGLDSAGMDDMRALFREMAQDGMTLIIASHNRDDISLLCRRVYEMKSGTLSLLESSC